MQLNSFKRICLFAAISIPNGHTDEMPSLTIDTINSCINTYESVYHLQDDILSRDMEVLAEFRNLDIADLRKNEGITLLGKLEKKFNKTKSKTKDHKRLVKKINKTQDYVSKWESKSEKTLQNIKNLIFGRRLKTERLRNLRIELAQCKLYKFRRSDANKACATSLESIWCQGWF